MAFLNCAIRWRERGHHIRAAAGPSVAKNSTAGRWAIARPGRPGSLEVAFPANTAPQLADPPLRPRLDEQLQSFVDDPSLGRAPARAQCLPHEAIVDVDVRAHLDLNV
jgi:hypothetical protein